MKTIYTIAAIAMFAVILGMGVLAPAMASRPDSSGDHKSDLCHYQEAKPAVIDEDILSETFGQVLEEEVLEAYVHINVDNKGKMNGHFKKGVAHHFPADEFGVPLPDENGDPRQGDFVIENYVEVVAALPNDSIADCKALNDALATPDGN